MNTYNRHLPQLYFHYIKCPSEKAHCYFSSLIIKLATRQLSPAPAPCSADNLYRVVESADVDTPNF